MVVTRKVASLALLSLGLAARQAAAVDNCLDLITAIGVTTGSATTTITLEADFSCQTNLDISTSQNIEITSDATTGPHTITIGTAFAGDTAVEDSGGASLITNQGTLTLNGVNFATESFDGNRAVYNTGILSVVDCEFNLFHNGGFIDQGGAIFSDSTSTVDITSSTFQSNLALLNGGAVYFGGSETLTITSSIFSNNEVGTGELGNGAGGDVWTSRDVELTVADSAFSGSAAEAGGAAIVCCGATILNSNFSSTDVASTERHFGAVQVGGPDEDACPREFTVTGTTFSGCSVAAGFGEGGSLAIFDTTATLTDIVFEGSAGTAILFESSSATGEHKLDMTSCQFNENTNPSDAYDAQGAAVVVTNTAVSDGDVIAMGNFFNMFCFANLPYECEFVYDGAEITHEGEFKCHICDIEGTRQATGLDDDLLGVSDRSADTDSSDDSREGILIGLAIAAGFLALLVIGGFTAWRCKKGPCSTGAPEEAQPAPVAGATEAQPPSASGATYEAQPAPASGAPEEAQPAPAAGATEAQLAPAADATEAQQAPAGGAREEAPPAYATGGAVAATAPPATASVPAATDPPAAPTSVPATTGTVETAAQA